MDKILLPKISTNGAYNSFYALFYGTRSVGERERFRMSF